MILFKRVKRPMNDSFVFATHKPDALFLHKRDLVQNELNYNFAFRNTNST